MYALNAANGSLQWSSATGGAVESPSVANGVVYVSARNGVLYAIDADYGEVLASMDGGFTFLGQPAISDGVLYFSTFGYNTVAYGLYGGTSAVISAFGQRPVPSSLHPDLELHVTH